MPPQDTTLADVSSERTSRRETILQRKLDASDRRNTDLQDQLGELEETNTQLKARDTDLEFENQKLKEDIESSYAFGEAAVEHFQKLESKIGELEEKAFDLETRKQADSAKIEKLERINSHLIGKIAQIKHFNNQKRHLLDQVRKLSSSLSTIHDKVEGLIDSKNDPSHKDERPSPGADCESVDTPALDTREPSNEYSREVSKGMGDQSSQPSTQSSRRPSSSSTSNFSQTPSSSSILMPGIPGKVQEPPKSQQPLDSAIPHQPPSSQSTSEVSSEMDNRRRNPGERQEWSRLSQLDLPPNYQPSRPKSPEKLETQPAHPLPDVRARTQLDAGSSQGPWIGEHTQEPKEDDETTELDDQSEGSQDRDQSVSGSNVKPWVSKRVQQRIAMENQMMMDEKRKQVQMQEKWRG